MNYDRDHHIYLKVYLLPTLFLSQRCSPKHQSSNLKALAKNHIYTLEKCFQMYPNMGTRIGKKDCLGKACQTNLGVDFKRVEITKATASDKEVEEAFADGKKNT